MAGEEPLDYDQLEEYFHALAYSVRLELLHLLRFPHALPDIRLNPRQNRGGANPERPISRQAIQAHLDTLMEIGVVVVNEPEGGRGPREYVVNGQRLYQIMEEFRQIGTIVVSSPVGRGDTVTLGGPRPPTFPAGPHLVLAHGLIEGKAFPLREADLRGGRGWVIGRRQGLHVSLDYDPFVSLENSEIVRVGDEYRLMDLRSSRNGTFVNWRQVPRDEGIALRPGDLIGVGRSLLAFRDGGPASP